MPSQTELSLASLLPTVSFLPPDLVALANSLLAQSRAKAATLKPEEEVARTYVCCHIACERLGNKLALDIGQPRPPVKPRIYTKLKTYFNAVLKTTNASTPKNRHIEDKVGNVSGTKTTPTGVAIRQNALKEVGSPSSSRKRPANGAIKKSESATELPQYIMPLIRHLCKHYDCSTVVPHVFAGVSSVLNTGSDDSQTGKKRRTITSRNQLRDVEVANNLPSVVVALFAITYEKMHSQAVLNVSAEQERLARVADDFWRANTADIGFPTDKKIGIELDKIGKETIAEWTAMEWYQNIPIIDNSEQAEEHIEDLEEFDNTSRSFNRPAKTPLRRREKHAERPADEDYTGAAGLLPGLGTMFQSAIDWLSDQNRADYASWRQHILVLIENAQTLPAEE